MELTRDIGAGMVLFDQLAARARSGGATALRRRTGAGWQHHGWAELERAVVDRAWQLDLSPGQFASTAGDPLLALAILLAGGRLGPGPLPEAQRSGAAPTGWGVQRRKELRPIDPACAGCSHGDLVSAGEAWGKMLDGPVVLASPGPLVFDALLGLLWSGGTLVVDDAEPVAQNAVTWVVDAERVRGLAPNVSRLGPLGAWVRRLGPPLAWAGPALRRVIADSPELVGPLRARGLTLTPPAERACASWT